MSKLIDVTGQRFGKLVVIERAKNSSQGKARWRCQCDCGNFVVVDGSSLRSGKTKSCGCYQRERTSETSKVNLIGTTIGNFTVLDYDFNSEKKYSRGKWKCRCNLCGNEEVYLSASNMRKQFSCGCTIASKGETKIKNLLNENHIEYISEKRFADCVFKNGKMARFDFYLPQYNCLIEYDGIQHFKEGKGNFDNIEKFQLTQEHDKLKNDYCKIAQINLIRIPYTHYDNIVLQDLLPNSKFQIV